MEESLPVYTLTSSGHYYSLIFANMVVKCAVSLLFFIFTYLINRNKPGMVAQTYNPSTSGAEAERS
jgi:uncharacterized PurR-regulated membrane protein YhhQ (DUF165 family)